MAGLLVSRLRSLPAVAAAARRQGLHVIPTLLPEVLFECPVCKRLDVPSLACVELQLGGPVVRCGGCERWGADPFAILGVLGHDPDEGEPHELVLAIFHLLLVMRRLGLTT